MSTSIRRKRHEGDTLTPLQYRWLRQLIDAGTAYAHDVDRAAKWLGVNTETVRSWVKFFTGDFTWPPRIDDRYLAMPIAEPSGYKWRATVKVISDESAAELRTAVQEWLAAQEGQDLSGLSAAAKVALPTIEAFLAGDVLSMHACREIKSALRGKKVWHGKHGLSDADIEAMKNATAQARIDHERYWLEQERQKYGLKQVRPPVSRMVV